MKLASQRCDVFAKNSKKAKPFTFSVISEKGYGKAREISALEKIDCIERNYEIRVKVSFSKIQWPKKIVKGRVLAFFGCPFFEYTARRSVF